MKKTLISISIACLSIVASSAQEDWANFGRYADANKTAAHGADAVFMGNSITEGWNQSMSEFLSDNGYINRGIGGQVTSQMLARFRPDVIELQPKSGVILAGTNDIAGNMGEISLDDILRNIVSMAELARYNGIKVILCSVLPAVEYGWSPGRRPAQKIAALNEMIRSYAERAGCTYVDLHSAMKDERGGLKEGLHTDQVHLTREGYRMMASILKPIIDDTVRE
ncbi:MAG: SGNH/GDSL hydrolase family protein [Rikenellaceae bacterium]|nr:SGNH/GDSL hydrolase family protein [Rikenellaceae bacterium]